MRKFVTAAATALTLGMLSVSAPAMADAYNGPQGNYGPQGSYQIQPAYGAPGYRSSGHDGRDGYDGRSGYDNRYGSDGWYDPDRGDGFRRGDRQFDWNRHEGNFDRWERGWKRDQFQGHGRTLSHRQLVRRLEAQGYYGVRGLREARWGWGLRAFAYNFRGRPVMLRINPYSGRVMDVRFV